MARRTGKGNKQAAGSAERKRPTKRSGGDTGDTGGRIEGLARAVVDMAARQQDPAIGIPLGTFLTAWTAALRPAAGRLPGLMLRNAA